MGLLEQLFDTGDSGIEDIGDVLRPFVFVGPAFGDFETRDSARSSRSSLVRPCGSKPASAISLATEIISRTTARSRTMSA